jgi:molecular chaperone DnaK (HSP70)
VNIKECYVGSTTNDLRKRKSQHKSRCENSTDKAYNQYKYQFIRDEGGWNNWDMIEVERYEAIDKQDLHKRERYWIESLGATLNKSIPTRDIKEYRDNNKEKIKEKDKKYYENNKEKVKKYHENYYEINKDKFKDLKEKNKEHFKEWRDNNRDKLNEYMKEYRDNNKEKIKKYYEINKDKINEKIKCECGVDTTRTNLHRHKKTQKHKDNLDKLE